jgi:hypothetical protein
MKRLLTLSLLAGLSWPAIACDQAPVEPLPLEPQLTMADQSAMSEEIREALGPECTFLRCTLCPVNAPECHQQCIWTGQCRDNLGAMDRNGNGRVCGATLEGPYIDDVAPGTPFLRMRPEVVTPCPSPAYPIPVDIVVLGS